ncbi:MAG: hypothetical protein ACP5O8_03570 [Candidatus Aenigmatarchaeota archaeon]
MGKKLLLILTFFFTLSFFLPEVLAGVGIGMGPPRLDLATTLEKSYSINLIIYNPGDYDIKARVTFDCENCEEKVYLFGLYLGRTREDYTQFFNFEPEEVYVPAKTIPENPVYVSLKIHPNLWIKKEFVISTPEEINFLVRTVNPDYKGEFSIPYYTLLLNEKEIKGGITATAVWSSFGPMGATPAVGSYLTINIRGMPLGSLILIIVAILIIIIGIAWKAGIHKRFWKKSSS